MEATRVTERTQDSGQRDAGRQGSGRQDTRLDARYGKIGISAVAAAVCHQSKRQNRPQRQESANQHD
jgi:hypothetical protein